MYKKLSITTIILLMLTITVSFAWMMDVMGPSGDAIVFHYDDSIYVSPNNLKIDISVEDNGEYIPLYSTENSQNVLAEFDNCAPGDVIKFSLKIYNLTDLTISTSVLLSDIVSTQEDFYNYVSVGIFATNGFDSKHKAPELMNFSISERMEKDSNGNIIIKNTNTVTFLTDLKIPPNEQEVEIKFYVRFDHSRENQNHLQNQTFTIGKINFMCI